MDEVKTSLEAARHENVQEAVHFIHVPPTVPLGDNPCEVSQRNESNMTIILSKRYIEFLLIENILYKVRT